MANILLVDDERPLLHSMKLQLTRAGHRCHCSETIAAANQALGESEPELAIIDIRLPDGNGLDLVRQIRAEGRAFPIVVLTAFGSIPNAVSAMRDGADDYVEKPVDLDQLTFIVERNLETQRLKGRLELYERTQPDSQANAELIGQSPAFLRVVEMAARVADPGVSQAAEMPNVLITGQTGTGKDVLARHIHATGPLASEPFVHVDCAALPRELIESELFGHERGAFTDAKTCKRGLLEIAAGGTVFLNEIGDLPLDLQAKLLTTLELRSYRRVGGTRQLQMSARIIAATNADLAARVEDRSFREDLYYRLNVFNIHLPPLRERGQDVALLADHFVARLCRKYRKPQPQLTEQARRIIVNYAWPGNVRELLHVLERACLLSESGIIDPQHLSLTPVGIAPVNADPAQLPEVTLAQAERKLIERALQRSGGNVSQAARLLGITRGALRRRLENPDRAKAES